MIRVGVSDDRAMISGESSKMLNGEPDISHLDDTQVLSTR